MSSRKVHPTPSASNLSSMLLQLSTTFFLLSTIFVHSSICGISDSFYIVTSPDNHCRRELTAEEPCLTLQQYAYSPSLGSNTSVALTVESGTHLLQGAGIKFDSEPDFGVPTTYFNMTGESAEVVYDAFGVHFYSPIMSIRNARYVSIRGVTFVSRNKGFVRIEHVEHLFLERCRFQGVRLYINNVIFDNWAVISMSSFSDYSHQGYGYNSDLDHGAISISNSMVYIIKSNFSANKGAVHYHDNIDSGEPRVLVIYQCIFSNNTSKYGGSAVHVDGLASLSVQESVFLFNSASGSGGAIQYIGKSNSAEIKIIASTFVYNDANFCGAFSVEKYSKYVVINDSTFYYNRAVNIDGEGGAVCIRNASVSINNSTFVANTVSGDAGALQAEQSNISISRSIFSNNTAVRDGGALFTSAHLTNYTITSSTFTHNKAGDDGGAVFVGRKSSNIKIETSTLVDNHASDRGGAIAIFGSTLDITQSNVYDNVAHMGKAISACNSFVNTYISGKRDPDFPTCTVYDDDIAPSNAPPFQDGIYSNVIWLNNTVKEILAAYLITDSKPHNPTTTSIKNAPNRASILSYTSLAISASLLIVLLVYLTFSKSTHRKCKIRSKKHGYHLLSTFQDQPESDDEELLDPNK